ncbi:MAG: hypothetical protein V4661_06820 [Pseudomonadota bacterium]
MTDGMARSIFYSARSFNSRADMLESSFEFASKQSESEIAFIKKALKKCRGYSAFRNSVVHGEPSLEVHRDGSKEADVQYVLTDGKDIQKATCVTIDDLDIAFENFVELKKLILHMVPKYRPEGATPEEYLRLVNELPNPPNSKRTRSGEEPKPQTPDEVALERKRIVAMRAAAGMNAGMKVQIRSKKK